MVALVPMGQWDKATRDYAHVIFDGCGCGTSLGLWVGETDMLPWPENTSGIITAIMKGGLVEQHGRGLLEARCLQTNPPFMGNPSYRPVQLSGDYPQTANSILRPSHRHMDSGCEKPQPAGDSLLPTQSQSKAFLGLAGSSGVLAPEREHNRVGCSTLNTEEMTRC